MSRPHGTERTPGRGPIDRLHDLLLTCYPAEFREEYGREMRSDLRARFQEEGGRASPRLLGIWAATILDVARTAPAEHLDIIGRDLRQGWRALRRDQVFLAGAAGVLALGIGALVAMLAVVSSLLLKPLPLREPDRLVQLSEIDPRQGAWGFSEPALVDLQAQASTLEGVAALRGVRRALTSDRWPEMLQGAEVTPAFFEVVGLPPIEGATFRERDVRAHANRIAVISRRLWERRFSRDPAIAGRRIQLDGESHVVFGVVEPRDPLLDSVDLFVPFVPDPNGSRSARDMDVIARLRPGVSLDDTAAELSAIWGRMSVAYPASHDRWGIRVRTVREWLLGEQLPRMLWTLAGAVALLWGLACVNVAGLSLARASTRRHDLAVRLALGGSRARIARGVFTESLIVAVLAAGAGLVVAALLVAAARHWGSTFVGALRWVAIDPATLTATAILAFLTALAFGLLPAVACSRLDIRRGLHDSGRTMTGRPGLRDVLVAAQVALAVVLLVGAGLLFRSFLALRSVDPGFDPDRLLSVQVVLPDAEYDFTRRVLFFDEVGTRIERLDGVVAAGASNIPPFGSLSTANRFRLEGDARSDRYLAASWRAVTPGFFRALNLPLVSGRYLDDRDRDGAEEVVVITESMARRFWPGADPVGRRLLWGRSGSPKTIVGVVSDLRDRVLDRDPEPTMFRPYAQLTPNDMTLLVRTSDDPARVAGTVRDAIWAVAPDVPLRVLPVADSVDASVARPKLSAWLVAAFAITALVLAAAGLYSLVAYGIARRRRELAIRTALGASRTAILWLVQRRALVTVLAGAAAGFAGSVGVSRTLETLLFGIQAGDPVSYAAVGVLLSLVVLAAAHLAARSAGRVDPVTALRVE